MLLIEIKIKLVQIIIIKKVIKNWQVRRSKTRNYSARKNIIFLFLLITNIFQVEMALI